MRPIINAPVPEEHKTASQFIEAVKSLDRLKRDDVALEFLLAGHVPSHMRSFVEVMQTFEAADSSTHVLTLYVLPDVLCVGTDDDYVRIPLTPLTAQKVCNAWSCAMPTTKISDVIWNAAVNKLQPLPWGPPYDATMMNTDRIIVHNGRIMDQLAKGNMDATALTAGHKKDVVMTPRLIKQPAQVAIFGWHQLNGKPIQPLFLGHENTYADYSHGLRMVSMTCMLDGVETQLVGMLSDQNVCCSVTTEGANTVLSQP